MKKIIDAILEKIEYGYLPEQLGVNFGCIPDDDKMEGYYIAKVWGTGSVPLSGILATEGEVEDLELIEKLDELGIANWLS